MHPVFSTTFSSTSFAFGFLFIALFAVPTAAQDQERSTKTILDLPVDGGFKDEIEEIAPEVVVFYGQMFECQGIFYCLDRSSSTCDGELEIEKREAIRNVREFSQDMEFAFVFFDRGIRKFPSNGKPVRATPGHKQQAITCLSTLRCGAGTCVRQALLETMTYVNACNVRRAVVIYLGDGQTTCPGSDPDQHALATLRDIRAANKRNVPIDAIHVGRDSVNNLSRPLADMNAGRLTVITR